MEERRSFLRFKPGDLFLVLNGKKVGLVNDISAGGLSFRYLTSKEKEPDESLPYIKLDSMNLDEIEIEIVADRPITSPEQRLQLRLRHAQFLNLTVQQRQDLMQNLMSEDKFSVAV